MLFHKVGDSTTCLTHICSKTCGSNRSYPQPLDEEHCIVFEMSCMIVRILASVEIILSINTYQQRMDAVLLKIRVTNTGVHDC